MGNNFQNNKKCDVQVHSPDFSKTIKLSSCHVTPYSSNREIEEYFINSNGLKFISTEAVLIEVVLIKPQTRVDKNILNLLECPVCTEIMSALIYQCKTGHSFCEMCTKKLSNCPICKQKLTNTCNYSLMTLSTQVYRPCKNREIGCYMESFLSELEKHEAECLRFECPLKISNSCTFNGDKDELVDHCTNYHEHLSKENYDVKWNLKAKNCTITKIICGYGRVFRSSRRFTGNDLYWTIQMYDKEEEARKYNFTIEFQLDGKKLVFSDVCRSVITETQVLESGFCIPYSQLADFISDSFCTNNIFIAKIG